MGNGVRIWFHPVIERDQRRACISALLVVLCCIGTSAVAQEAAAVQPSAAAQLSAAAQPSTEVASLPDAPAAQGMGVGVQAADGQATGVVFGTVKDTDGALVEGAQVTLTSDAVKGQRKAISGSGGDFQFSGVVAGKFGLSVSAKGLASEEISGTLQPGGIYTAPPISLRIATANIEVDVSPQAERAIAQQQVKTEETQRVLGIVPNYFVTYDKNPVPLVAKQKFSLGLRAALDPTHFLFAAGVAGLEQMTGQFSGYGPGPQGFGKRYGAALATTTTSELLRGSVYPSLFRQDPRYFYKGTGSTWSRTKYALDTAIIAKGDNGHWQPNYSAILAGLTAGAISNLYYAPSDRNGPALTFESGALSLAGVAFGHLMQEFVFRAYTTHAPPITQP
jgi:hypothetical protein